MTTQIHIAKIYSKMMDTKFGPKMKYTIEDATGRKLDVWEESWDPSWQEGMNIEIEKELIKTRQFDGKTYYTYQKPYTIQNKQPTNTQQPNDLKQILSELSKINTTLAYIKAKLDTPNDYEQTQNEINKLFP